MADIFKLMGRIVIDASGADTDIDKITKKAQSASKKINASFEKIGKAFTATTKGIGHMGKALIKVGDTTEQVGRMMARGIAIGTAAFSTAAATIGKNALDIRSSIEQGLGGAEAVFGNYSKHIIDESQNAWQTAGLSMEQYLATANKMGSLFKGAGFTEMQAMEYTANAMQRAADVASIMGIDVSVAMESIAGAAKGNFTMMDNLGVAMNDTTLEAYRLEKGFDKAVSTMTTAEKVELAMQMFMERTADYAGNYAKENETAAGSLTTLKAAWSNFLGGVGSFSDLEQSAFGYLRIAAKTMGLDSLEPMINGAQETVQRVAEILSMEGLDGRQKFANIRRYLLQKSVTLAYALGEKIPKGISNAASVISETLSDINVNLPHYLDVGRKIFESVRDGVKQTADSLTDTAAIVAPDVISGWFTAKTDFIGIGLDFLGKISEAISEDLDSPDSKVGTALSEGMSTVLTGLKNNLPKMFDVASAIIGGISDAITEDINGPESQIVETLKTGLHSALDSLAKSLPKLTTLATSIIDGIAKALTSKDESGKGITEKAGDIVGGIVGALNDWIKDGGVGKFTSAATSFLLGLGAELVDLAPSILSGFVTGIWQGLNGVMSGLGDFFSRENEEIKAIKETLAGVEESFNATKETIELATQAYDLSMADLNARLSLAEGHLKTIQELESAAALSPEQQTAWQAAVQQLVALYPELGKYVDDETGKFTINTEAIRANIAELQNLAKQKTLQKIQEEYLEGSSDAAKSMVNAYIAREDARELYQQWKNAYDVVVGLSNNHHGKKNISVEQGNALKAAFGNFDEWYELKTVDGVTEYHAKDSNRYQGYVSESDMNTQITRWVREAWENSTSSSEALQKAEKVYSEAQAYIEQLNADFKTMSEAYNAVFPDIAQLGTDSSSTAGNVSNLGTAASNAADELNSIEAPGTSGVTENAKGAVFSAPTIFDTRLGRQMVGEAGPEAVAPISVLQNYVRSAVQSANIMRDSAIADLAAAISDLRGEMNTNMNLYINKRHVASAMSRDMGRSIGNREYMLMRGMGG